MPAVTTASTPEASIAFAGMNAKYPVMSAMVTSTGGLSRRRRTSATTKPTTSPTPIPPTTLQAKRQDASQKENEPATTAVTAIGSVGDTIAPSTKAALHDRLPIASWATTATTHMVATTSPMESRLISRTFVRRSRREVKYALR